MTRHCTYINQVSLLLHKAVWAAKISWKQNLGTNCFENSYGEHNFWKQTFGSKLWEEKLGEQILLEENLGSKFLEEKILLRASFWGRKFGEQNVLGGIFGIKFHSWKKSILGNKNVLERKGMGS